MEINQAKFAKVVEAAKVKAAGNARWIAAIDKASAGLAAGWIVTELADGIMVTTESGQTYHANGDHCQCEAFRRGQACKHRGLYRLVELYNVETESSPAPRKPEIIRSVERDVLTRRRVKVTRCDGWTI